ncbi:hypothetical protein [Chryseobacterium sp. M5A1_1a]
MKRCGKRKWMNDGKMKAGRWGYDEPIAQTVKFTLEINDPPV